MIHLPPILFRINIKLFTKINILNQEPRTKNQENNSNISCWGDSSGNIHFSNTGFPNKGKYTKLWVKQIKRLPSLANQTVLYFSFYIGLD